MSTALFSFKDAVHDHLTIGFVHGCVACAQTEADMALSRKAARANEPVKSARPLPVVYVPAA